MKNSLQTFCLGLIFAVVAGCAPQSDVDISERKIRVTTTTAQVGDTVRNVGGERVEVTDLMGPGTDPHLYKASQGDISKMGSADVIFYNGLMLEGRMTDVFARMNQTGKPTVAVAETVDKSLLLDPPEYEGHYDPHIWMDASLWAKTIPAVVEALSKLDPEHQSLFEANAETYEQTLLELHDYTQKAIASIPKQQRVLITAHDAFGYFGKAYDIEVMGLQGISTASDYGLKDIERLVNVITQRKVKAVFIESSIPTRSIEAVIKGCEAIGHNVVIGGELYSDAMGEPGSDEDNYPGMFEHNVDTIVKALKG